MGIELVAYANDIASLAMAVVMFAGLRGMWPLAVEHDHSATMYLARGLVLIFAATMLRSLYWDVLPTAWHILLPGDLPRVYGLGTGVNTFFIALNLWGVWHIMRALLELVPDAERFRWTVFTIAFYPRGTCWQYLTRIFGREK